MTALDVNELLDFLEQSGLEIHLDGGWAVDALLGEQTRSHDDLDIAIPHAQVPAPASHAVDAWIPRTA